MSAALRRRALVVALCLAAGLFIVVYRGPGWRPLRAHGGDVAVVVFLVALLGLAWPRRWAARAVAVGVFALATELYQLAMPVRGEVSLARELTVGSTFDPLDLAAYALGLALAVLVERRWLR